MNKYRYYRVSAASPTVRVADVSYNVQQIIKLYHKAVDQGSDIVVFPELCITGYTCGDLFRDSLLLDTIEPALATLTMATSRKRTAMVVGAPLRRHGALYNCAVVIANGCIRYVVPKTYLPNSGEFYEKRRFTSSAVHDNPEHKSDRIKIFGESCLFTERVILCDGSAHIAIELCEDLWVPIPPSSRAALNGANIVLNLSATNELAGKNDYIRRLIEHQSAACMCGYVYASAGVGESSTDLVFAGNAMIAENGHMLAASKRFTGKDLIVTADIDLELLDNERLNHTSFTDNAGLNKSDFRYINLWNTDLDDDYYEYEGEYIGDENFDEESEDHRYVDSTTLLRDVDPHPFVPSNPSTLNERCSEIVAIQSAGLQQRLRATGCKQLVVGISGGLDSTLALLVAVNAFDALKLDRSGITGITMPGFGTTDRTHDNAVALMELLGVTTLEIPIAKSVLQHFEDIGQDPENHDVTYENGQARERTQILMDYANKVGAMVLGTGDLSELALGWCTYNGDHMSMYGVNASIPKTLVQHLVKWFAHKAGKNKALQTALLDIVDTPISPELIPADSQGQITQKTEDLVGPYELHDFFLYHLLRHSYTPAKIYFLATRAFRDVYTNEEIKKWLKTFYRRFFNQQFKRSCMPDGPKVGSVCLSPRGDWRMPSDAASSLWLKMIDKL